MSSNNSVSILEQIIGTSATPAHSNNSARSLNSVSITTSHYRNAQRRGTANNSNANESMKAIVLSSVSDIPTAPSQPNLTTPSAAPSQSSGGNWFDAIRRAATGGPGAAPAAGAQSAAVTAATDYPMYYVWILPNSLNKGTLKPVVVDGKVSNISSFPVCSVKDTSMIDNLLPGAIIRMDYEDRATRKDGYVMTIVNNDEEFGRAIFLELEGLTSAERDFAACNEQSPAVSHSTGDPVATRGSKIALSNAYKALGRAAGSDVKTAKYIYDKLYAGLRDKKIAIGILANADEESRFDAHIVSGDNEESSLGLWQMNVGSRGGIGVPKASIMQRAREDNLTGSIQIPSTENVVVYFGGGVLAATKGVSIVTAVDYTNQDLSNIYETVANADTQIDFVINTAKSMLASIEYKAADITAGQWAQWWQIYFEQPADVESRVEAADRLAVALGVTV
jgi:hypothetical protein